MKSESWILSAVFAFSLVGVAGAQMAVEAPLEPQDAAVEAVQAVDEAVEGVEAVEAVEAVDEIVDAVEVGNTVCPVMKEPIEAGKEVKVTYKGKIYNLCCPMCQKKFLADPDTYVKVVEDMMKESE